jgi:agmatine deiminase
MPAEWEKHSAVWLAWPYDETTFPKRVEKVEQRFIEIISAIHTGEKVELLVLDDAMKTRVTGMLKQASINLAQIIFRVVDFQDVWIRDYGPTFIINPQNKELALVKWQYNAYGKASHSYYSDLLKDNEVFLKLRKEIEIKVFEPGIVMEGGSIEVNGKGTLIATEQCLLNPNRNPNLNKEQIEKNLKDCLGVNKIIWLKKGLANDHTDGHIDDITRFVSSNKILVAYEDDTNDENYQILNQNFQDLSKANNQDGKPFEIVKLPMPHMQYEEGHTIHSDIENNNSQKVEKATVSYLNFYIGNSVVLVPVYNDPNDEKAIQIIQSCFPDRKIVGIDCREIIYGGGAIHCMTQQQPAT